MIKEIFPDPINVFEGVNPNLPAECKCCCCCTTDDPDSDDTSQDENGES